VRRIKKAKALFDPLILTFSLREKGQSILNLMAVRRSVGTIKRCVLRIFLVKPSSALAQYIQLSSETKIVLKNRTVTKLTEHNKMFEIQRSSLFD